MDVLKKIAKCYKDIKTVFSTKLKIAVGAIEEVATAIHNFVVGEIDEVVNNYEQKDANVKEQLMNKMITGLDVHVDEYKNDMLNGGKIMFAPSAPVSTASLANCFRDCKNLLYVDTLYGNEEGGIYKPTTLSYTFNGCNSLEKIDFSKIDLSNCTSMSYAFYLCKSLYGLDVRDWDVSSLKTLDHAFYNCSSLTELEVSNWDVRSLENMAYAFYGCTNLAELDVSKWNTRTISSFGSAFYGCSALRYLDLSGFDLSGVTSFANVFYNCRSLESLILPNIDYSRITNLGGAFRLCQRLKFDGDTFRFNGGTSSVESFSYCFSEVKVSKIEGVDFSSVLNKFSSNTNAYINTSSNDNSIALFIYNSNCTHCEFAGNHNIMFDCIFNTQGWQTLDSDSIASFIVNCLYDYSEDEGEHIFRVTSAMYNELQTKSYGAVENVYEHVFDLGWDLQYS